MNQCPIFRDEISGKKQTLIVRLQIDEVLNRQSQIFDWFSPAHFSGHLNHFRFEEVHTSPTCFFSPHTCCRKKTPMFN